MSSERIRDLRELEKYKERFRDNEWIDSLSLFKPTGARIIGEDKNLFIYHFDKQDVEDFMYIYRGIDGSRIDKVFADFFRRELMDKCEEMNSERICPLECMLYSSKAINKFISNRNISEAIADVGVVVVEQCGIEGKEVLGHILQKWHWLPQLRLAVEIAGRTRDIELLRQVYRKYGLDERMRVPVFKALVESGHRELLPYIFNMVRNLQKNKDEDRHMMKLLENNIYRYMPEEVGEFEKFLSTPGITNYVYNRINNYILPYKKKKTEENMFLNDTKQFIFELSHKANPESDFAFNEKEEAFEKLIEFLKDKSMRKHVLFALRNTKRPEAAAYILQTLKSGGCKGNEIKDALVTLGFLGYKDDDHFLARSFSNFDISLWTYYYLSGKEEYLPRMIEHLLTDSRERAGEIVSHLNQFYGARKTEIQKEINEQFVAVLRERDAIKVVNAANNVIAALENLHINDLEDALNEIFRVFGFNEEITYGLDEEQVFLSLLELTGRYYVKNFKNKNGKKLERFLFYVAENYDGKVQSRALKILKSVEAGEVGK